MNQLELYEKLSSLPQFVEPDRLSLPEGVSVASDWKLLFDITSYRWISINDNVVECLLDNDAWVNFSDDQLDKFVQKQQAKGEFLKKNSEKFSSELSNIINRLDEVFHLNKCVPQDSEGDFTDENVYYLNMNNRGLLTVNKEHEEIYLSRGDFFGIFTESEKIIKILLAEESLSLFNIAEENYKFQSKVNLTNRL